MRYESESEAVLYKKIEEYLTLRHIPFMRTHGVRNGRIYKPYRPGAPDYIGCLPWSGRMFQIEAKDDEGIVSAEQEACMREFYQAKALVMIVRTIEELSQQINAAGGK